MASRQECLLTFCFSWLAYHSIVIRATQPANTRFWGRIVVHQICLCKLTTGVQKSILFFSLKSIAFFDEMCYNIMKNRVVFDEISLKIGDSWKVHMVCFLSNDVNPLKVEMRWAVARKHRDQMGETIEINAQADTVSQSAYVGRGLWTWIHKRRVPEKLDSPARREC